MQDLKHYKVRGFTTVEWEVEVYAKDEDDAKKQAYDAGKDELWEYIDSAHDIASIEEMED